MTTKEREYVPQYSIDKIKFIYDEGNPPQLIVMFVDEGMEITVDSTKKRMNREVADE